MANDPQNHSEARQIAETPKEHVMFKLVWRLFFLAAVLCGVLVFYSMTPRNQLDSLAPELTSHLREWGTLVATRATRFFQVTKDVLVSVVR